jgi:hypothetical protein
MQNTRSIGADLDPGAYLAQGPRTLVHMDIGAGTQQRQRSGNTADAAAYDRYAKCPVLHGIGVLADSVGKRTADSNSNGPGHARSLQGDLA